MTITLNKKIKKRKINLIIPKGCNHDLIFPNYTNLNFNLIIPRNSEYNKHIFKFDIDDILIAVDCFCFQ